MMAKRSLAELREEMRAVARGERKVSEIPAVAVLNVLAEQTTLDLLSVIAKEKPASVSELARLTGRAQSNISRTLHQLVTHGLVRLDRVGKEVRPTLSAGGIKVDFRESTYTQIRVRELEAA